MSTLSSIVGQVVVQLVAGGYLAKPRGKGEVFALAFAALSGLACLVFAVLAGYRWLNVAYGAELAPALAAAAALVLFSISCIAAVLQSRRRRRFVNTIEDKIAQALSDFSASAEKDVEKMTGDNPKAAMALASLAGFLLARRLL